MYFASTFCWWAVMADDLDLCCATEMRQQQWRRIEISDRAAAAVAFAGKVARRSPIAS